MAEDPTVRKARLVNRSRRSPSKVTAGGLIERGLKEFYLENEEEALDLFLQALALAPDDLRIHYLLTLSAHVLSREDILEQACGKALELNRHHPWTRACEAMHFLYLSNYDRAEELLSNALRDLPDALELHVGMGIVHEYSGDNEKGMVAYRQALARDPENVRAIVAMGGFYAMSGEYDSALEQYRHAHALAPDSDNPHQRLGRDYYYEGQFELAMGEFARSVNTEPDDPAGYFFLLDCLRRVGRSDDAIDLYCEIGQRFGDVPDITSGFYEHFNMRTEAVAALEQLLREQPDDSSVLVRLSFAYREAGRLDDAARVARELTRLAPKDANALAMLGELYLRRDSFRLAASCCRRAIRLDPNTQTAYLTLADALLYLGRQEDSWKVICEMERVRNEAWEKFQARFSGQDPTDSNG